MKLLSCLLSACFLAMAPLSAEPTRSPQAVIAATPEYDLAIRVLPDAHHLDVSGTLRLPASAQPRATIEFKLGKVMKDFQAEILEPAESAGPAPSTQQTDGDAVRYTLHPRQPIAAGRPVALRFTYGGGEEIAFVFYIGPEGSFAGGPDTAWYPQFEESHGRGRGRLAFSVPAGYTVLASGRRLSADADEAKGNFVFEQKAPDQFSFAAGKYTVLKRDGVVPMRAYLLNPHADAQAYLDGSSQALAFLAREFGPYPYGEFAIAEVPSDKAEKAGFSGASMAGFMLADREALDEPFNLAYYAHEIGHQWWGNLVTQSGERGAYILNEGMAQLGSLRAVESLKGEVAAEQYRRDGYPGYSSQQCGYGYLLFTESGLDHRLLDLPKGITSHSMADSKGFLVLDLLSRTVGRENFRSALHQITRDRAFQDVTWEEFVAAVGKVSRQDLGWFFAQWFGRTGAPDWRVAWTEKSGSVHATITQSEPYYRARLEVEARGVSGETSLREIAVEGAKAEVTWPVSFRVATVVLDPRFHVLHWLPELHGAAQARGPSERASYLRDDGKLDEAESVLRQALTQVPQPDPYAARFLDEYGMARVFMDRKAWTEAETHLAAALAAPSRDPDVLPWVYYRYAQVAQELHDDAKLRWAADAAASADASLPVASGAAGMAKALLPASATK